MTITILPAGTDVAEMALFDVDALPRQLPRRLEDFTQLTSQDQLLRFPTGADGGYLLHLFVNEAIPVDTMQYCLDDDKLTGAFYTSEGRVAFGGLESAYAEFKPNPNIRSDGLIAPGRYTYTAYQTEFPDELVMQAVRVERTTGERWLGRAPVLTSTTMIAMVIALAATHRFALVVIALLAGLLAIRWLRRLPGYRDLIARREQAQLAFPSIVVELRSSPNAI